MQIQGAFLTRTGRRVSVAIITDKDRTKTIDIGAEGSDVLFDDDPVSIESQSDDTFEVVLTSRATVRLLVRRYMSELFCPDCFRAAVTITRDGVCLFAGFVEPNTYSQDFNETYDSLELTCVDMLSALEYKKYRNIGLDKDEYEKVKQQAEQRTFYDVVAGQLNAAFAAAYTTTTQAHIYYDGSKTLTGAPGYDILKKLSINELLFLGDDEKDVWSQKEVTEEILRYLGLHIIQIGFDFYVFSWETVKTGKAVTWYDLETGTKGTAVTPASVTISTDNVADDGTQIDVGEVFNRISLTCDIEKTEAVIESPLDNDLIVPAYSRRQKFMTEYFSEGRGYKAHRAFWDITHGRTPDAGDAKVVKPKIRDWYIWVKQNKQWTFFKNGVEAFTRYVTGDNAGKHQESYPNAIANGASVLGAGLFALGKVEKDMTMDDDSPNDKPDLDNMLFMTINGNEVDVNTDKLVVVPSDDQIKGAIPYAEYKGKKSGGVFSPADSETTNYIVFSGKIVLNPIMHTVHDGNNVDLTFGDLKGLHGDVKFWDEQYRDSTESTVWYHTVKDRNNGDGRYLARQYYQCANPMAEPAFLDEVHGLVPFTDDGPQLYQYNYSARGNNTDQIKKLDVIQCMLIIGDKCVVEAAHTGMPSDFKWQKFKERADCKDDDEYYAQSFALGVNPKIKDFIIGQEHDMQDNNYNLGIDAEGTCIPIRKSDAVSGQVRFLILGPVNSYWDDITRRHPTFFRHTKWTEKAVPVLAHTSSIIIKQFECKIYSDNGQINSGEDNDLIYMSDTDETFINEKDDITFKINSALTSAEAYSLGVPLSVSMSTPLDTTMGTGVLSITDQNRAQTAKPEQLYVDAYYNELHQPRPVITQNFRDFGVDGLLSVFTHPAMEGRKFYSVSWERSVIDDEVTIKLRDNELSG